jgi:hypothetical protein
MFTYQAIICWKHAVRRMPCSMTSLSWIELHCSSSSLLLVLDNQVLLLKRPPRMETKENTWKQINTKTHGNTCRMSGGNTGVSRQEAMVTNDWTWILQTGLLLSNLENQAKEINEGDSCRATKEQSRISGKHLGSTWEASGLHLRSPWEAFARHMRHIWEVSQKWAVRGVCGELASRNVRTTKYVTIKKSVSGRRFPLSWMLWTVLEGTINYDSSSAPGSIPCMTISKNIGYDSDQKNAVLYFRFAKCPLSVGVSTSAVRKTTGELDCRTRSLTQHCFEKGMCLPRQPTL